jgi:hypothetical protein
MCVLCRKVDDFRDECEMKWRFKLRNSLIRPYTITVRIYIQTHMNK